MDDRAKEILEAAVAVATERGFDAVMRPAVAERAGCSPALISHYWGETRYLQDAVMQAAVEREILSVIAFGLMKSHPAAWRASPALRERAASSILA